MSKPRRTHKRPRCTVRGCDRPHVARGYCNTHYHRWLTHGDPTAVTQRQGGKPLMVVARTTKGKGVSYMENVPIWHYRSPNKQEYEQAVKELEAMVKP